MNEVNGKKAIIYVLPHLLDSINMGALEVDLFTRFLIVAVLFLNLTDGPINTSDFSPQKFFNNVRHNYPDFNFRITRKVRKTYARGGYKGI
jgi:hypothetical protein